MPDWPEEMTGPNVFNGLGESVENPLNSDELESLGKQLGDFLNKGMRQLKDNKAMHTDRNSASLHSDR
jgi:hypothetical protein